MARASSKLRSEYLQPQHKLRKNKTTSVGERNFCWTPIGVGVQLAADLVLG